MLLAHVDSQATSLVKRNSGMHTLCEDHNGRQSSFGKSEAVRVHPRHSEVRSRKCSHSIFSSDNHEAGLSKAHKSDRVLQKTDENPAKRISHFTTPNIYDINLEQSEIDSSSSLRADSQDRIQSQENLQTEQSKMEVQGSDHDLKKLFHHLFQLWFFMYLLLLRFMKFLYKKSTTLADVYIFKVEVTTRKTKQPINRIPDKRECEPKRDDYSTRELRNSPRFVSLPVEYHPKLSNCRRNSFTKNPIDFFKQNHPKHRSYSCIPSLISKAHAFGDLRQKIVYPNPENYLRTSKEALISNSDFEFGSETKETLQKWTKVYSLPDTSLHGNELTHFSVVKNLYRPSN
jgi:hypothetical protein